MRKRWARFTSAAAAFIAFLVMTGQNAKIMAAGNNVSNALKESGITNTGDVSNLYSDANGIVYVIMAMGGFWIVGMFVWGGMTLAASGGNPQKRTEGIIKLSMTVLGAYVIFKAYDIAGWATGLGSAG